MKKIITVLFCLLFAGMAEATVVDFEDIAVASGANSIGGDRTSGGFDFDLLSNHSHLSNNSFSGNSGSTFLVTDNFDGINTLTMTRTGGGAFTLNSLQLGEWNPDGGLATTISLMGTMIGGAVVNTTLNLDGVVSTAGSNNFETFSFISGWENLVSLTFSATAGSGDRYWAVDNIDVSNVPAPATLALIIAGLAGLGFSRKSS